MITHIGNSFKLGATLEPEGVNFCIFSPRATSVELLLFDDVNDVTPTIIDLDPVENKSYYYWHIFVPGLKENQLYGYRINGTYDPDRGYYFDASKVLVDPYAKAIVGEYDRRDATIFGKSNIKKCLKSAVINDDSFDWENDAFPNHELTSCIVYELHVAGFTKNPNSELDEKIRGTYRGLIEKIPYIKDLGVTAVELMPVFAFDEQDAPEDRKNYWGYSPINFFAVHAPYASTAKPQEIVDEFKAMVKAFHAANIEVYLDVVYNHTTENDGRNNGPTLCFRGIENSSYYMMSHDFHFLNFTGTGNTMNANHSVVRRMITDSLNYWVEKMHIDGFRFDLASVLSRDEHGNPLYNSPVLWSIDSNPILSRTKIIAEPWDAAGLYQVNNFSGDRWIIWNDKFRDAIRRFVKGDAGQVEKIVNRIMGSPYEVKPRHKLFSPELSLNFVTCHDGFTMNDLVSYNTKHNFDNGEDNRDGHNENHSWNCGVEGYTDDPEIVKLRHKQVKNFFSLLLLSQGTPMITMGDEILRTQYGNNNAYCQDKPLAWMDWSLLEKNKEIYRFVRNLIRLTKQFKVFSKDFDYLKRENPTSPYIRFHGVKLNEVDTSFDSRALSCEIVAPKYGEHVFVIMNMYWEPLSFELPKNKRFHKVFDTENDFETCDVYGDFICSPRTVAFVTAKSRLFKQMHQTKSLL
ncbi:glycogen debranching protein GlgX [Ornithobacterium rhinotracheale]|uniref:glycogen debranching protein GlgX n=1 Tax=Ornithobacterium rhinotracheale TaxID=28251 RepID=UPI004036E6B0